MYAIHPIENIAPQRSLCMRGSLNPTSSFLLMLNNKQISHILLLPAVRPFFDQELLICLSTLFLSRIKNINHTRI
jgi:hypothetical protein